MLKAFLMIAVALAALVATPANATVIYNWNTVGEPQGRAMSGRIGFDSEAWKARRAAVSFKAETTIPPFDQPGFIYPGDLDIEELFLASGCCGTINLMAGEANRSGLVTLSASISFDELNRMSGRIRAFQEFIEYNLTSLSGEDALWNAQYRLEAGNECFSPGGCISIGEWVLDPTTIPVAEPGGLPLLLAGILGLGMLTNRRSRRF